MTALLATIAQALVGCATLPPPPARAATQALADPGATPLGQRVAAAQPRAGLSGIRVVTAGNDAYAVLTSLADQAQRTLDLQYYLVHNEPSVRELMQHVRAAADRGVRVRLLVDDLHTAGNDEAFRRLTAHPRIEVRVFNPLPAGRFSTLTKIAASLHEADRVNRRMHNKMFVADNALAFTGGRNLGDAYFLQSSTANFVDMDMLVAGPAVQQLSRSFDRYWNSELAYPITAFVPELPPPPSAASAALDTPPAEAPPHPDPGATPVADDLAPGKPLQLVWARARLLADAPSKIESPGDTNPDDTMYDDVESLLKSAQREVLLISPYLVPGERGVAVLEGLRKRGVRVRILTCGLASTDAPVVHIGYAHYRTRMLAAGIELYELKPRLEGNQRLGSFGSSQARLHAKAMGVDGRFVLIGSMNLDPRSKNLNSEIGLLMNSPAIAGDLHRLFDDVALHGSYAVSLDEHGKLQWRAGEPGAPTWHSEPESGALRRLGMWLLTPLAPEQML